MKKLALVLTIAFASFSTMAQKAQVFTSKAGAIRGYDPVAYFTEGKPVKGVEKFTYRWKNATWSFASQQNRDLFAQLPEKYAPQYGGYCAYGCSSGYKAPTEADAWTIVNGKLYFNYNLKVREAWNKAQSERIAQADKVWPVIKDKE